MEWARKFNNHRSKERYPKDLRNIRATNQVKKTKAQVDQNSREGQVEGASLSVKDKIVETEDIVHIEMENNWINLINLSFTVHTFEDLKTDSVKEILFNLGWNFVKVTKIGFSTFLFTVEELELMNMLNWEDTRMWISNYEKTGVEDLVIPRVACVHVFGLTFIAATKQVLEGLIGSKGTLMGVATDLVDKNQIPITRICIYTKSGELVEFSRMVSLDDRVYKIWFKEIANEVVSLSPQPQNSQNNRIDSWIRSPTLHDVASSTNDLDMRIEESEQVISTEKLNVEEDFNVNPDMQDPPFGSNRMENWGANSQFEIVSEKENFLLSTEVNLHGEIDTPNEIKEVSTALADISQKSGQESQQQGGRSNRKNNQTKLRREGNIRRSSMTIGQGHKNFIHRKLFKVQQRKQSLILDNKRQKAQKERDEAGEILSLGKDLGLEPIFSDNDTLNIIISRIRNQ